MAKVGAGTRRTERAVLVAAVVGALAFGLVAPAAGEPSEPTAPIDATAAAPAPKPVKVTPPVDVLDTRSPHRAPDGSGTPPNLGLASPLAGARRSSRCS